MGIRSLESRLEATRISDEAIVCPMCFERTPPEYIVCPYCGYDLTKQVYEVSAGALGIRGAFGRIYNVIRQPRLAMQDVADHPDRFGGLLVMLALSMFLVLSRGPAYLIHSADTSLDVMVLPFLILGGFVFLIIPILMWMIGSAIFWIIAKMLGGRGVNFSQTQSVVGYGLTPLVLWAFISIPILILGLPSDVSIAAMADSGAENILTYLMLIALIWSVILIGIGLTRAHLFSRFEGMIIAALPIIGLMIIMLR